MKTKLSMVLLTGICFFFSSCRSGPPKSGPPLEITSDPPGAKIEINNEYIGVTPWSGWFRRSRNHGFNDMVVIKAYPVQAGQHTQVKFIPGGQQMPNHVYFDMNLGPASPSIDVNIRQTP